MKQSGKNRRSLKLDRIWDFLESVDMRNSQRIPNVVEDIDSNESSRSLSNRDNSSVLVNEESNRCKKVGYLLWFCRRFLLSRQNLSIAVSLFVHLILVFILFSVVISLRVGVLGDSVALTSLHHMDASAELLDLAGDVSFDDPSFEIVDNLQDLDNSNVSTVQETNEQLNETIEKELTDVGGVLQNSDLADKGAESSELGKSIPFFSKTGTTSSRSQTRRSEMTTGREGDVTKESEDAVERGLEWLARHQLPDGGWAFDLTEKDSNGREGTCNGLCSNSLATSGGTEYRSGLHPSRTAATALAVLPFLGAGYIHTESNKYQKTVAAGLRFLEYNAITKADQGIDFRAGFEGDGAAYIQALAVLVCCEAYEMTKDPSLKPLAEGGLKMIEESQLDDGGWRYSSVGDLYFHSNISGDISVLGWQMMALKSGISAGFSVKTSVAYRASSFLDLVMAKDSRSYRYQPTSKEKKAETWGTTAVGVLTREYLGWEPGYTQLDAGAKQIADWIDDADLIWQKVKKGAYTAKSKNGTLTYFRDDRFIYNLYFSYYASLALHHYGGTLWKDHFYKVRDLLVETQSRGGSLGNTCDKGSWLFYDRYMNDGGRLLNTSLAILILETPYRFLPMYQ